MMDLLSTLPAASGDVLASAAGGDRPRGETSDGEAVGGFGAALAALARPLAAAEDDVAPLAATPMTDGDEELAIGWPVALLRAALAGSEVDGEVPPDDVESSLDEPIEDADAAVPVDGSTPLPDEPAAGDADEVATADAPIPTPQTAEGATDVVQHDARASMSTGTSPSSTTTTTIDAEPIDPKPATTNAGRLSADSDAPAPDVASSESLTDSVEPMPARTGAASARQVDVDGPETAGEQPARAARPSSAPSTDAETLRAGETAPTSGPSTNSSVAGPTRSLGMTDGVRRVMEVVELLEHAPPPRQLTIEVGEARLRVALEDGGVRLSVVGGGGDEIEELLRSAENALTERGFDLGGDGERSQPNDPDDQLAPGVSTTPSARARRAADAGLRL